MEEYSLTDLEKLANFEISERQNVNLTDENHFTKLEQTSEQKIQTSLLVNQMPNIMAANTLANAYIAKFPDGLQHSLTTLKQGGFMSMYKDANGKFAGTASLYHLTSQAAVMTVFSAMSVITGQHYLTEINSQLMMINQGIDKVMEFLYGDKKAELLSEVNFVQSAYKNYASIMSHPEHRTATIAGLQEARRIAMKDIEFYLQDLDTKSAPSLKSYSEFVDLSEEALRIKDCLELSMQLYLMSNIMEVHYAQNYDSNYLGNLKDDASHYINRCDTRILSNFGKFSGYNKNFKSSLIKKMDTSILERKFEDVINSSNLGDKSQLHKVLDSVADVSAQPKEYYLSRTGDMYIPTE